MIPNKTNIKLIITVIFFLVGLKGIAQQPSSFPPKSYPASIKVSVDNGVAKYWDVKRMMYLGPGNSGHKFRVFGSANADHEATSIEMYYILPGNKLQTAGAYLFPAVKKGESFNFDIVSAFTGYAPKSFSGFLIKDKMFPSDNEIKRITNVGAEKIIPRPQMEGTIEKPSVMDEIRVSDVSEGRNDYDKNQDYINTVTSENEEVFTTVEQQATYPGGLAALMKWLGANMRYPEVAQKNNVQGRVIVRFIIEKDGRVTNASIQQSVDADLDKEALRIVSAMPKWIPGKTKGMPVRSYYVIPITFRLQSK